MGELISVMIVEDEKLTMEDLKTIIDWEACGYKIAATAFNGKQGLKKYRELHPQLIFTDIRMPFMDGIDMISQIRKENQKVSIVLLTAYEDFGYAKAAISLGITEYVIKSEVTEESLKALLGRLERNIMLESRKDKIVTDRMLEQFFLSGNGMENSDIEEYLKRLYHIILIEQDLPVSVSGEQTLTGIAISTVKIVDLLSSYQYTGWNLEVITILSEGQIVLALSIDEKNHLTGSSLFSCADSIRDWISQRTLCSFSAYVFSSRINLYDLKRYCDVNKSVFHKKLIEGSGRVNILEYPIMYKEVPEKVMKGKQLIASEVDLCDPASIKQYFGKIYGRLAEEEDWEQLLPLSKNFYFLLLTGYRRKFGKIPYQELGQEMNWRSWLDAGKISEWFIEQFDKLNANIRVDDRHYSKAIKDSIEYIHSNYRNPDLSLNEVADYVNLSAGYLSGAFKKEVGDTLKNYVTDVRIDAAKKLIEQGNHRIYEIGLEVGYRSSQYFSQVFYKKVGMFPAEYRRKE